KYTIEVVVLMPSRVSPGIVNGQECQWSGQKLYGSAECVWLSLKFTHYQIFYQRLILFNVP
ncbi:hypothetical protein KW818_22425, partial [Enterobacter quasiroggenkampii]|uniref:hypothetical protein n=1 Tax=Enterobacter quasiroggenkampii TaxID=2497436 RepID=UPI0021CF02AE